MSNIVSSSSNTDQVISQINSLINSLANPSASISSSSSSQSSGSTSSGTTSSTQPSYPAQTPLYYVPNVGYNGSFTFKAPFDTLYNPNKKYTVTSIRDLKEMRDSNENPYEYIFQSNQLTQNDFNYCVHFNIPIAVLTDSGDNYYYIPCNYIEKINNAHGFQYIEKVLVVSLGYIPIGTDLTQLEANILSDVKDNIGVISTVETLPSSGVVYVTEQQNNQYLQVTTTNKGTTQSFRQLYQDLKNQYKNLEAENNYLKQYLIQLHEEKKI